MQAHLASVLKGVVKDKSKGALSRLLGERAAASRLLERIEDGATWHARIGIVLVDDARLRSYTPRAASTCNNAMALCAFVAPCRREPAWGFKAVRGLLTGCSLTDSWRLG